MLYGLVLSPASDRNHDLARDAAGGRNGNGLQSHVTTSCNSILPSKSQVLFILVKEIPYPQGVLWRPHCGSPWQQNNYVDAMDRLVCSSATAAFSRDSVLLSVITLLRCWCGLPLDFFFFTAELRFHLLEKIEQYL